MQQGNIVFLVNLREVDETDWEFGVGLETYNKMLKCETRGVPCVLGAEQCDGYWDVILPDQTIAPAISDYHIEVL